jgi:hypothetical protein
LGRGRIADFDPLPYHRPDPTDIRRDYMFDLLSLRNPTLTHKDIKAALDGLVDPQLTKRAPRVGTKRSATWLSSLRGWFEGGSDAVVVDALPAAPGGPNSSEAPLMALIPFAMILI